MDMKSSIQVGNHLVEGGLLIDKTFFLGGAHGGEEFSSGYSIEKDECGLIMWF